MTRLIQLLELNESLDPDLIMGSVKDGQVAAVGFKIPQVNDDSPEDEFPYETPTHAGLGLDGTRWRYPTSSSKVFWWEQPTEEEKAAVEAALAQKGYTELGHHRMIDDHTATQQDWDLQDYAHGYIDYSQVPVEFTRRQRGKVQPYGSKVKTLGSL